MKRIVASAVLAAHLLVSPFAAAEGTSVPLGDTVISPLRKDQPAPFTGVLFSPRAAATMVTDVATLGDKVTLEVNKAVGDVTARKDFEIKEAAAAARADKAILQAGVEARDARIKALQDDLRASEAARAAAPNRSTWAGVGFVGGLLVTLATVFVVNISAK